MTKNWLAQVQGPFKDLYTWQTSYESESNIFFITYLLSTPLVYLCGVISYISLITCRFNHYITCIIKCNMSFKTYIQSTKIAMWFNIYSHKICNRYKIITLHTNTCRISTTSDNCDTYVINKKHFQLRNIPLSWTN